MKSGKGIRIGLMPLVLVIILIAAPCGAESNLRIGSLEIHPLFAMSGISDDNIYIDSSDEKHDYITQIAPGLRLEIPREDYSFKMEYLLDMLYFAEYDTENSRNSSGKLVMDLNFPSGWQVYVYDKYQETSGAESAEVSSRLDRRSNQFKGRFGYQTSKLTLLEAEYLNSIYRFDKDYIERNEHSAAGRFSYFLRPETMLFSEYSYGWIEFPDSSSETGYDITNHRIMMGVRGRITSKMEAVARAGAEVRQFDESGRDDYVDWAAGIEVNEEFTPLTRVSFDLKRQINESIITYDNTFVSTSADLTINQILWRKLSGKLGGGFQRNDFLADAYEKDRIDDIWKFRAGLNYELGRFLNLELEYEHKDSNSDIPSDDTGESIYNDNTYSANSVRLGVKGIF